MSVGSNFYHSKDVNFEVTPYILNVHRIDTLKKSDVLQSNGTTTTTTTNTTSTVNITHMKFPCWTTLEICGFNTLLILRNATSDWDTFILSSLFIYLFKAINGHCLLILLYVAWKEERYLQMENIWVPFNCRQNSIVSTNITFTTFWNVK